jgi:hypothetical protein
VAELVEAALADTPVGGAVRVVIEADSLDALDVPLPVAVTVKVYAVPLDSPVTVMGEDEPVAVSEPGELVTV